MAAPGGNPARARLLSTLLERRCSIRSRAKSGYFWSIARDDSAWRGNIGPPAVAYTYALGRGVAHAATLLAGYCGIVQCDGYAAYKQAVPRGRAGNVPTLAFCWATGAGVSTRSSGPGRYSQGAPPR
jgi:transposase IS66 family protein